MKSPPIRRWIGACRLATPDARRHLGVFAGGAVMALGVVACRIALPWPLKAVLIPWIENGGSTPPAWLGMAPAWLDPTVAAGAAFLLLLVGLGFADHRERLSFARFAIGAVRDLRGRAAHAAIRLEEGRVDQGDLIARLIGDTARIKAGLKGFLVHVATNGAMFLGVTIVLFVVDPALGVVFAVAGIVIALITTWGASAIFFRASKYREREGALASTIQQASNGATGDAYFRSVNETSAQHEAAITKIQGRTTWAAHVTFGLAVVICLWLGARGVSAGELAASDLVLFVLYALMMRAPMVQLARQGARTGKIFACLERVAEVIQAGSTVVASSRLRPLKEAIILEGVKIRGDRRSRKRRPLGPVTLTIGCGQRVAIIGDSGAGKTALLGAIYGSFPITGGKLTWDRMDLTELPPSIRRAQMTMVTHEPTWTTRRLRDVVSPNGDVPDPIIEELLFALGAKPLLRRLTRSLDTKVPSSKLSMSERRQMGVAGAILSRSGVLLMDDPVGGLPLKRRRKLLRGLLDRTVDRTVVLTMGNPMKLSKFDRVIELRRGRIEFDGTPEEYRERRKAARAGTGRRASGDGEESEPRGGT